MAEGDSQRIRTAGGSRDVRVPPLVPWPVWVLRLGHGVFAGLVWALTRLGSERIEGLWENAGFFVLLGALAALTGVECRWQRRAGDGRLGHMWLYVGTGVGLSVALLAVAPGLVPGGQLHPIGSFHYLLASVALVGAGGALCEAPLRDELERRERRLADDFAEALIHRAKEATRS